MQMLNLTASNIRLLEKSVLNILKAHSNYKRYTRYTSTIYFQAYFYLSKRFGDGTKHYSCDTDKDAAIWRFKVKYLYIDVRLSSCNVLFYVYAPRKRYDDMVLDVIELAHFRNRYAKRHLLIHYWNYHNFSEDEQQMFDNAVSQFAKQKNILLDTESDEFWDKYDDDIFEYIDTINEKVLNFNWQKYKQLQKKYGKYRNAQTRYAIRTFESFLKNMLVPIDIDDCSYNIKGRVADEDYFRFMQYKNNIKITLK